jgi:hypothetical protein
VYRMYRLSLGGRGMGWWAKVVLVIAHEPPFSRGSRRIPSPHHPAAFDRVTYQAAGDAFMAFCTTFQTASDA